MVADRRELFDQAVGRLGNSYRGAVFVEAIPPSLETFRKWQKYGFIALYPMVEEGFVHEPDGTVICIPYIDGSTPYGQALRRIHQDVMSEALTMLHYKEVVDSFANGEFDDSQWAAYLPDYEPPLDY